jgi:hypothetical protein
VADENAPRRRPPLSPQHVQVLHLDNAAKMVNELAEYTDDGSLPSVVQNACLESFFVNVRLPSEFLLMKSTNSMDFQARELVPDYQPAQGEVAARLLEWWQIASSHVVHFGKARLADREADDLHVTRVTLDQMSADTLSVYGDFRQAYRDRLDDEHPDKHLGLAP